MHKPWPFINTFLKQYNIIYTQIFGGIFFYSKYCEKKNKVKTIKCSFYEFIHKKKNTVNIGIFEFFSK